MVGLVYILMMRCSSHIRPGASLGTTDSPEGSHDLAQCLDLAAHPWRRQPCPRRYSHSLASRRITAYRVIYFRRHFMIRLGKKPQRGAHLSPKACKYTMSNSSGWHSHHRGREEHLTNLHRSHTCQGRSCIMQPLSQSIRSQRLLPPPHHEEEAQHYRHENVVLSIQRHNHPLRGGGRCLSKSPLWLSCWLLFNPVGLVEVRVRANLPAWGWGVTGEVDSRNQCWWGWTTLRRGEDARSWGWYPARRAGRGRGLGLSSLGSQLQAANCWPPHKAPLHQWPSFRWMTPSRPYIGDEMVDECEKSATASVMAISPDDGIFCELTGDQDLVTVKKVLQFCVAVLDTIAVELHGPFPPLRQVLERKGSAGRGSL